MKLFPYQIEALRYTFQVEHPALFMDMRLGKSVVYAFRSRSYTGRNLIVCPLSAIDGWVQLLHEATILYGTRQERLELLRKPAKFYIINWNGYRVIPEIASVSWNSIVLDESTQIKNPKSKATKYFSKNFRLVTHHWILTGTPDTESTLDLICQFNFLDSRILPTYWDFRDRDCYMSEYMKFKPNSRGDQKLARAMKYAFIKTRDQVDFPCTKIYENRYLELPKKLRKQYDLCEREFLIEGITLDKTLWTIQKAIWLRLMTSGLIDGKVVWEDKLEETKRIIESTKESVIIWATFIDEFNELVQIPGAVGINGSVAVKERSVRIKDFNSGKNRILIAQPECFRFGADLSRASCMIYFSQPNSLITKTQTEDRIVHLTKKCPVMIYNMIVKNSIDEDMVLAFKEKRNDSLRLREMVNGLSN